MDISFVIKWVWLNVLNTTMEPTGDEYISFIDEEEADEAVFEVTTSILRIEVSFLTDVNHVV